MANEGDSESSNSLREGSDARHVESSHRNASQRLLGANCDSEDRRANVPGFSETKESSPSELSIEVSNREQTKTCRDTLAPLPGGKVNLEGESPSEMQGNEKDDDSPMAGHADGQRNLDHCAATDNSEGGIVLQAKWGAKIIEISMTETDFDTFSIADLKLKIQSDCNIPRERQKFLGMTSHNKSLQDNDLLSSLTFKKRNFFVLVGTPLEQALADPSTLTSEVVNDLEWDFVPTRDDVSDLRNETHLKRLRRAIDKTKVHLINAPRPGKKLLVLDLDNTVFDCRGVSPNIEELKRPFLEHFMREVYQNYDLVVWSQTHWKWVEMKCTDLGFLTSPAYNLCFVLDRSSMFSICSRQRDGSVRSHEVKALELIWEKFPDLWGPHNTLHVDDLGRNFALNPKNGVKVSSYRADRRKADSELLILARYLKLMSTVKDLAAVDHSSWKKKTKYDIFEQ